MFPVTDKSKSIVDALFNRINELGDTVFTKTQVTKLLRKDVQIIGVETELENIYAPCVVLTTGGRTYPSTGATGDGYKLAKKMGHTISPLYPT
ncbi:NAD(P)/FAD-dependent oxidoreductase, partial [Enterococcus faecalis]|uniref:NAD(P)/FAD-dependent oxidoreductase n=1 Tax=Enterococcus faecalis TaxID=1351 RepID=UPI003CC6C3D7